MGKSVHAKVLPPKVPHFAELMVVTNSQKDRDHATCVTIGFSWAAGRASGL